MPEIIYLIPSLVYLFYKVAQEPEETDALKYLNSLAKAEEAHLKALQIRNRELKEECYRLELIAGLLN